MYLVIFETAVICRCTGWYPVFYARQTNEGGDAIEFSVI